jgi:hypothetical protein
MLTTVVETRPAISPMNFAHSAFALALAYQAQGIDRNQQSRYAAGRPSL